LILNNVLLAANIALVGGGMVNSGTGTALLTNTTLYGNHASDVGGGMVNDNTATLTNVTVTGHVADSIAAGGIANTGDLTLTYSRGRALSSRLWRSSSTRPIRTRRWPTSAVREICRCARRWCWRSGTRSAPTRSPLRKT